MASGRRRDRDLYEGPGRDPGARTGRLPEECCGGLLGRRGDPLGSPGSRGSTTSATSSAPGATRFPRRTISAWNGWRPRRRSELLGLLSLAPGPPRGPVGVRPGSRLPLLSLPGVRGRLRPTRRGHRLGPFGGPGRVRPRTDSRRRDVELEQCRKSCCPLRCARLPTGAASSTSKDRPSGTRCRALVSRHPQLRKHLYDDAGKLRIFVNIYLNDEDVRYLEREGTPSRDGTPCRSSRPSREGPRHPAAPAPPTPATLSNEEIRRYSRHLIMPEVGMEGQKKLKSARRARDRRGRARLAARALPRGGRRRHDRHRRLRRRRRQQPAAPGHPRHDRRRPAEARVGARSALRDINPHVQRRDATRRALDVRERAGDLRATTT